MTMGDEPGFEELGSGDDPVGDMVTRQVQQFNRVDILDEYMEYHDLEHGDKVFVICKEDEIIIKEASADEVL